MFAHLLRLLLRIFRSALLRLPRRLIRLLSAWLTRTFFGRRGGSNGESSPLSQDSKITTSREIEVQEDQTQRDSAPPPLRRSSYTIAPDGHTISLEGISTSAHPCADHNICHTAPLPFLGSTDILPRSRPGSPAGSFSNIELQTVSCPRYSLSAPHLNSQNIMPERSDSPSPSILTSPVDDSPTRLDYPAYHLSTHTLEIKANDEGVSERDMQSRLQTEIPSITSSNTHVHVFENDDRTGAHTVRPEIVLALSSSCASSLDNRDIQPEMPGETERYQRRTRIKKEFSDIIIKCAQLEYSDPGLPEGWTRYAHPEGARYFYHTAKKLYTDAEIYDPVILRHLTNDLTVIESYLEANGFSVPLANGEIVINVYRTEVGFQSKYYCVDHEKRLVFFVDEFQARYLEVWHEVPGVISLDHLKYEIMAQYWFFVQLYPHNLEIKEDMLRELRDIVLYLITNAMTSRYSTAQYTLENLHKILSLVGEMTNNLGTHSPGSMCLLARQMYIFNHTRFLNVHGESYARIERNFSIYGEPIKRTWLIRALSLPLFSAPDVHLETLKTLYADRLLHVAGWAKYRESMNGEFQACITLATVVLNANVAFLAIQSVDVNDHPYRSPAQIASYVSVILDITSIIAGLLLVREKYLKGPESADVQAFLPLRLAADPALEIIAILYSSPYALLMWGMLFFCAAFCFMCFDNSNLSTRIVVGLSCSGMAILLVWYMFIFRGTTGEICDTERPLAYEVTKKDDANNDSGASLTNGESKEHIDSLIQDRVQNFLSPIFELMGRLRQSVQPAANCTHSEV